MTEPDRTPVEASATLSAVIVSYNTRDVTFACLQSVVDQSHLTKCELIVIDNGSTDGSPDEVERHFPGVSLIRSECNAGFARASNAAAERAAGEFILLLNSDTLILGQAIDKMVEFARAHPDRGIWGGRTLFADGSLNSKCCWRFMSLWSLFSQATGLSALFNASDVFNPEGYGGWLRDTVREVDFIAGCFLLIRRDLWDKLGGFDERFFMYGEEADLCYRARLLGARPLFTPDATIVHYGGASESVRAAKIQKLFAGKLTFINKHWREPKRAVAVRLLVLHALVRAIGYSALAGLSGADKHRKSADEWREVWRSRDTWSAGYPGTGLTDGQLGQA